MRYFPVDEITFDHISNLNDISLVSFSLGSFFGNIAYSKYGSPDFWIFSLVTILILGLGVFFWVKKKGLCAAIKNQSADITRPS